MAVAGGGAHGVRDDSRIDEPWGPVRVARADADGRNDEPDHHAGRSARPAPAVWRPAASMRRRGWGSRWCRSAWVTIPPWRIRGAWDQFAVPRPYSRARAVAGPKVQIPAGVSRAGVEHYRQRSRTHAQRIHHAWPSNGPSRVRRWRVSSPRGDRAAAARAQPDGRFGTPARHSGPAGHATMPGGRIEHDGYMAICLLRVNRQVPLSVAAAHGADQGHAGRAFSGRVGGGRSDRPGTSAIGASVS